MKHRLTYKCGKGLLVENNIEYGLLNGVCYQDCVDKLGRFEAIEDELGIDLVTLFKALKSGVYFKNVFNDKHSGFIELIEFSDFVDVCYDIDTNEWFIDIKGQYHNTTKNYGKTWALTKEELL